MTPTAIDYVPGNLTRCIGRHTGIIRDITLHPPTPGETDLYYCAASITNTGVLTDGRSWSPKAGGVGIHPSHAVLSAFGEAIERYCSAFPKPGTLASYTKLSKGEHAIRPSLLSSFSRDQYQDANVSMPDLDDRILRWFKGRDLRNKEDVWVPAAWVMIPYDGHDYQIPGNTTGLACGPDYESASFNALLEVIERDAYVQNWLFRGHPPRVRIEHTDFGRELGAIVPFDRWHVTIYDLTGNIGIPVFLVAMRPPRHEHTDGEPLTWYCQGAAAHLDGRIAIRKALLEACLSFPYLENCSREVRATWESLKDPSLITDFDKHAMFYNVCRDHQKHLGFLDHGEEAPWGQTPGAKTIIFNESTQTDVLTDLLDSAGVRGAIVDLTTDDVRSCGLRVVRAILEEFPWLHGDHRWPFLGTPRVQAPHHHYPYIDAPRGPIEECINPWPHAMG